jgi:hypothetical protein
MLHKVSDRSGHLLDAAVAQAMNRKFFVDSDGVWLDSYVPPMDRDWSARPFRPSLMWEDAGPIIERERIALYPPLCVGDWDEWSATVGGKSDNAKGPTPLIAAMRAFVASRFGETVELLQE